MVKIVNYQKRENEEGKTFFTLELQGGIEVVKSQESGKFYVTAKRTNIPSTFDEMTCQSLIGSELPGTIAKVSCTPYEYTIKETQEVITLSHRYEYLEEDKASKVEKSNSTIEEFMSKNPTGTSFSTNGHFVEQE